MADSKLNKEGRDTLEALRTGVPVQNVDSKVATALIEGGYAVEASVQLPKGQEPGKGKTWINATARGRGVRSTGKVVDTGPSAPVVP